MNTCVYIYIYMHTYVCMIYMCIYPVPSPPPRPRPSPRPTRRPNVVIIATINYYVCIIVPFIVYWLSLYYFTIITITITSIQYYANISYP